MTGVWSEDGWMGGGAESERSSRDGSEDGEIQQYVGEYARWNTASPIWKFESIHILLKHA